jgi:flagellum-specific ATP synthase
MGRTLLEGLRGRIARVRAIRRIGRVTSLSPSILTVSGLSDVAALGDGVLLRRRNGQDLPAEIMRIGDAGCDVMADGRLAGIGLGDRVRHDGPPALWPDDSWIGRIIDPSGHPLDGRPIAAGKTRRHYLAPPPPAGTRRGLGPRLETGIAAFNTLLPIARGQRLGLFSGSGVGKSSLLAALARTLRADVVVIGLIGERGREVRHFTEQVLGPEGMARSVVIAATSDQSALARRRCGWASMAVAEHFRDAGHNVLLLADSVTRFAEAHRDIALACGEAASLQGFPPSLPQQVMELAERAGPGGPGQGDITAIFTVLVAASDMEGPVADTLRGTLDGHVVLDRAIAERGRYPAIDLLRSVSRSLPAAATADENKILIRARQLLGTYQRAELMIQSGLYTAGSDLEVDEAIQRHAGLDTFLASTQPESIGQSYARLRALVGQPPAAERHAGSGAAEAG